MFKTYQVLFASAAAVCLVSASGAAQAQTRPFNIEAQPAQTAIPLFARQAGLQILAPQAVAEGVRTNAVKGDFTPDAALGVLLKNTGLEVRSQRANW